jgi:hypothetical protein
VSWRVSSWRVAVACRVPACLADILACVTNSIALELLLSSCHMCNQSVTMYKAACRTPTLTPSSFVLNPYCIFFSPQSSTSGLDRLQDH